MQQNISVKFLAQAAPIYLIRDKCVKTETIWIIRGAIICPWLRR